MAATVATGRFEVDPAQLRQVSSRFAAWAADLGGTVASFEARTTDVEEAFGLLGPSDDLYRQYLSLARDCAAGLEQLRDTLDATATRLSTTADNYGASEAASAIPGPAVVVG